MENNKLNGFNNGRDTTDGVGGKPLIIYENPTDIGGDTYIIGIDKPDISISEAIKVLQKHLREDKSEGSYYHSWMCSLKFSSYDAVKNCTVNDYETGTDEKELLQACENAAINFLELLIKE